MAKKKRTTRRAKKTFRVSKYVLNCVPSARMEEDWTFEDAVLAGIFRLPRRLPGSVDLRKSWWRIQNQGSTGACVGFATADGVLHWHYRKARLLGPRDRPSPRFIWMADKETDELTSRPTTFLEKAGTQTKLALRVAQRYGCVLESHLPMAGGLSTMSVGAFYMKAARLRIRSYNNLGRSLHAWRAWLALQGPVLTRLGVDRTWDRATLTRGKLDEYKPKTVRGGHAVCLVGYTPDHFIVRNSWGTDWGHRGFAYASNRYAAEAFTEAYGAVL